MVAVEETRGKTAARRVAATRDPERTRAAILDAATQEFTANGLNGARVDAIAQRARVNKRMIYHYFGGKDGLYLAVLEAAYEAIRVAELELHLTDRDPADGMRELVLFTWRYFLAHPEFLSLLGTENLNKASYLKRSKRSDFSTCRMYIRCRPSSDAICRLPKASRRADSISSMSFSIF
jgi:AcrR family transcriptional regulator